MASNTEILIKRSLSTDTPASLLQGELAYSYSSNTLFIGTPGSAAALAIAGYRNFSSNYSSGAGQYGNTTTIPVVTVGANGLITAISTASISTELDITADSGGPSAVNLLTQTLDVSGGDGITTSVAGQTITVDVDNTVFRANTPITTQYIDSSVQIAGNLTVLGTETIINVETLKVDDPLLQLAANNTSDVVDIGFFGHYYDGVQRHTGLYRHANDKLYYLFSNYSVEPTSNVITPFADEFALATLRANITANTANAQSLYVSNIIYGDTGNNTIILAPSTSYAPGVNDQYIIVDPTAPNHIHLRAGGAIDSSNADLYLGGEETNVLVSDSNKQTYITANNNVWTFQDDGILNAAGKILATQGAGTAGGFSFSGTEGGNDSGMFSPSDGNVHLYANNVDVAEFTQTTFTIKQPTYLTGITQGVTGNLVYFNASTGELTYASDNALTPTSIANGAFSLSIQSTDGLLVHNGAGIQLANGAIIKDTTGDAVAFGQNAGTLNQGLQAVAIGDSAGYNAQGAYGVAIGYGAGNQNQGQTAVAIGINAGISNQGNYGIAIGNSAGGSQGNYGIALGYDSGGSQGNYSIAIGNQAGKGNTSAIGINTIAIGNQAAFESAVANTIILNASGLNLSPASSGFFVNPVAYTAAQDATYDGIVFYNSSTKEVRYSYALDGGSF